MNYKKPISGLEKLRSLSIVKQRSIPLRERSTQTELYLLNKEKQRYLKERQRLMKRLEFVEQRLKGINQETRELLVIWSEEMQEIAQESAFDTFVKDQKEWKTKTLNY